jgi:hypothetical protein
VKRKGNVNLVLREHLTSNLNLLGGIEVVVAGNEEKTSGGGPG